MGTGEIATLIGGGGGPVHRSAVRAVTGSASGNPWRMAFADPLSRVYAHAATQDDVVTTQEAIAFGMTTWGVAELRRMTQLRLPRGAVVSGQPRDPLRSTARATQLLIPQSTISHLTAARLRGLQGLSYWQPRDLVDATVAPNRKRSQRAGVRLHFSALPESEIDRVGGIRTASTLRTLLGCARSLDRVTFLCLVDSALNKGLLLESDFALLDRELRRHGHRAAALALEMADARSESPSESRVKLVLTDAGFAPEHLQHEVWTPDGFFVARLDIAWTFGGRKVGMEVDSEWHDRIKALYRDRDKLNTLRQLGWDVRQVTAADAHRRPGYVVAQAREALARV